MSGSFKPEDFEAKIDVRIGFSALINYSFDDLERLAAAELANIADAKRWACPKGGEHEPVYLVLGSGSPYGEICEKCGGRIRARWEAM